MVANLKLVLNCDRNIMFPKAMLMNRSLVNETIIYNDETILTWISDILFSVSRGNMKLLSHYMATEGRWWTGMPKPDYLSEYTCKCFPQRGQLIFLQVKYVDMGYCRYRMSMICIIFTTAQLKQLNMPNKHKPGSRSSSAMSKRGPINSLA